jgi:hypothetical protein
VERALPDYKQRIAAECELDLARNALQDQSDASGAKSFAPLSPLTIKDPFSKPIVVPVAGTGSKRLFFPPVGTKSPDKWCYEQLDHNKSSLYRVNEQWDRTVVAKLKCPTPDPSIFDIRSHAPPEVRPLGCILSTRAWA